MHAYITLRDAYVHVEPLAKAQEVMRLNIFVHLPTATRLKLAKTKANQLQQTNVFFGEFPQHSMPT
jgi:hypothetical protein